LGGGVTYGPLAAYIYNKNQKLGIISEVGKDFDNSLLNSFKNTSIDLTGIRRESQHSTNYKLYYHDGVRDLTLESCADPIKFNNIPNSFKSTKCFMFAPIANEIPDDLVDTILSETDAYIGADVQGFIRKFNPDGTINKNFDKTISDRMKKILKKCGERLILKASDEEANYIANMNDFIKSTQYLSEISNSLILTTLGSNGSLIKKKGIKMIHIPALLPDRLLDETGAGDCYSAVFLSEYLNSDHSWESIKKAGYCASAACSYLIEEKGPHGFESAEKVQARLKIMNTIKTQVHDLVKNNNY
jgi:sugar/nucleoside kinase (ribokinase family)